MAVFSEIKLYFSHLLFDYFSSEHILTKFLECWGMTGN